jgi:hypothetical protein
MTLGEVLGGVVFLVLMFAILRTTGTGRGIAVLVYCLLLTAGTALIIYRSRPADPEFVTSRNLPSNWRLGGDDVIAARPGGATAMVAGRATDSSAFIGRYYVLGPLLKGQAIRFDETDTVPRLVNRPGYLSVQADLPSDQAKTINADSCVSLSAATARTFHVQSMLCPTMPRAACTAVVEVPVEALGDFAQIKDALSVTHAADCPTAGGRGG